MLIFSLTTVLTSEFCPLVYFQSCIRWPGFFFESFQSRGVSTVFWHLVTQLQFLAPFQVMMLWGACPTWWDSTIQSCTQRQSSCDNLFIYLGLLLDLIAITQTGYLQSLQFFIVILSWSQPLWPCFWGSTAPGKDYLSKMILAPPELCVIFSLRARVWVPLA